MVAGNSGESKEMSQSGKGEKPFSPRMIKEWDFRTAPGNLSHLLQEVVFQRRVEVNQFLGCLYVRYMLEKDSPPQILASLSLPNI